MKSYKQFFCQLAIVLFFGQVVFAAVPVINSSSVGTVTGTGFTLTVNIDIASTVYYAVTTSATPPSLADIKAQTVAGATADGTFTIAAIDAGMDVDEIVTGLMSETDYWIHFFAEDGADQTAIETIMFTTADITPPTLNSGSILNIGGTQFDLRVNFDEVSTVYYVVTTSNTAPSNMQVRNGQNESGGGPDASGNFAALASSNTDETIVTLTEGTLYYVYFIAEDASSNQSMVETASATTSDNTAPSYNSSSILSIGNNQFDLRVNFDEASTVYYVVTQSNSSPSILQVRNGQDETGSTPDVSGNFAILASSNTNETITGLSGGTQYYVYFIAEDASNNRSSVEVETATTTSAGVVITAPTLEVCTGNGFVPIGDIRIQESSVNDFKGTSTTITLILSLDNTGFIFESGVGTADVDPSPAGTGSNDINAISINVGFTNVTVTYTMDGSSSGGFGDVEAIVISGLMVQSDGSQATTNLRRSGGTADQVGNNGTAIHATLSNGTSSITFSNDATANTICEGDGIQFTVGNNAGYSNYDFSIDGASAQNSGSNTFSTSALTDGQTVSVIASGGAVCSDYEEQSITVVAMPSIPTLLSDAIGNDICEGASITFEASPLGATSYTFTINGAPVTPSVSNMFTTQLSNGDQVTVIWTDAIGCSSESGPTTITTTDFTANFAPVTSHSWESPPYLLNTVASADQPLDSFDFSGPGVVQDALGDFYFDPSVFTNSAQTVLITYNATKNGCTQSIGIDFNVFDPSATIQNLQDEYCLEDNNGIITIDYPVSPLPSASSKVVFDNRFFGTGTVIIESNSYRYYDIEGTGTSGLPDATQFFEPNDADIILNKPISLQVIVRRTKVTTTQTWVFGGLTGSLSTTLFLDNPRQTDITLVTKLPIHNFFAERGGVDVGLSFCETDAPVDLKIVANKEGIPISTAVFSGDNVTLGANGYVFDPGFSITTTKTVNITLVTQNANSCTSDTTIIFTVYPDPTAPTTILSRLECQGNIDPLIRVTPDLIGATYNWYDDPGLNTIDLLGNGVSLDTEFNNASLPTTKNFYVTQIVNGCESQASQIVYTILATPIPSINNFPQALCANGGLETFNLSSNGTFAFELRLDGIDISPATFSSSISFDPDTLSIGSHVLEYILINEAGAPGSPCPATAIQNFVVNPEPNLTISLVRTICKNDDPVEVNTTRNPTGGIGTFTGVSLSNIPANNDAITSAIAPGNVQAFINPSLLVPDETYIITYVYTDTLGCSSSISDSLFVFTDFDISIDENLITNKCEGDTIDMVFQDGKFPISSTSTITSIEWTFNDGISPTIVGNPLDAIPVGTHDGRTTGTFANPQHVFNGTGTFNMEVIAKSSDGCLYNYTVPIQINQVPIANFFWTNVCLGSPVEFAGVNENPAMIDADIQDWLWDFGDGMNGTGKLTSHNYAASGNYNVTLTIISTFSCTSDTTKIIYQVPSQPQLNASNNNSYMENFDTSTGGWIVGGDSASWQLETPSGGLLYGDAGPKGDGSGTGMAWKTSDPDSSRYNVNEQSWVHSPCIDISQLQRPVFQMDIWHAMDDGIAGVVVQVNVTDSTEDNSKWQTLGKVNEGLAWYTNNGIQGQPGLQSDNANVGWTGNISSPLENTWTSAAYELDDYLGETKIRFRIALGNAAISADVEDEGFAFDNVFIGERTRTVLLENFINTSSEAVGVNDHNIQYKNFLDDHTGEEVVGLQYHTSFPGDDPINKRNIADPNARAAYYGVDAVPIVRLDGNAQEDDLSNWLAGAFGSATLIPADVRLSDIETPNSPAEAFNVRDTLIAVDNLAPNTIVHVVVVEKIVTANVAAGENGETEFYYVVRKMLPDATGTKFPEEILTDETRVIEVSWDTPKFYDRTQAAVVVFVQNEDTGEILQAKVNENPSHIPAVFTAIDPELANNIIVYPNPANDQVIIMLKEKMSHPTPVTVYDTFGKLVFSGEIESATGRLKIETSLLSQGMYHIQIKQAGQENVNRRLIVIH